MSRLGSHSVSARQQHSERCFKAHRAMSRLGSWARILQGAMVSCFKAHRAMSRLGRSEEEGDKIKERCFKAHRAMSRLGRLELDSGQQDDSTFQSPPRDVALGQEAFAALEAADTCFKAHRAMSRLGRPLCASRRRPRRPRFKAHRAMSRLGRRPPWISLFRQGQNAFQTPPRDVALGQEAPPTISRTHR